MNEERAPTERAAPKDHGLFLLYPSSTDGRKWTADIVAIHGLGGHAFKTWTDSDGHLWLRDSLPQHIPNARIMTYGYDSAVAFGRSRMGVADFALDLLSRLRIERGLQIDGHPPTPRPIIFICHSLGGVVFKQALITAALQRDHYGDILESTYGVVFMGTPHRGSRIANQAGILSRIINVATFGSAVRADLLDVLRLASRELEQISQLSISLLKDLSIVSFYEQKPLGPSLIVEPFSAILGLPNERAIPINADHRKMARVSPRVSHRYLPVWKAISELTEGCFLEITSHTKELLDALHCVDYKQAQLRPRQPHRDTCGWLFQEPAFHGWAQSPRSSILWLSGPPGVGKSVLTRCLAEYVLAGSELVTLTGAYVGVSFFCSYNEATFNSEEAVLRSLLHQLVQIKPQCQSIVRNRLQIRTVRGQLEYRLERDYLWMAIEEVLALDTMRRCLIAVDAIEELPSDAALNILSGFYNVIAQLNQRHPNHRLRVFVSSRYNSAYNNVLPSVFAIRTKSPLLSRMIEMFVRDSVVEFATTNEAFAEIADFRVQSEITSEIVRRADGMFLWAKIALEDFKRGLLWNRTVLKEKLMQLDSSPPGINMLYDRMMGRVDESIRKDMWSIFSVLAVAARPLNEKELGVILAIKPADHPMTVSYDIEPFVNLNDIVENNFPELVAIDDNSRITFTHLSFKEYLFQYWSEKDPGWLRKARSDITRACLIYLDLKDIVREARNGKSLDDLNSSYPLFAYATNFYLTHLRSIPLDDDLWLQFADLGHAESIFTTRWVSDWSPLEAVVSDAGVESQTLVRRFAAHGYDLDDKWISRTALNHCCSLVTLRRMKDMAFLLLELGANPNDKDRTLSTTSLQDVVIWGAWDLYEKFIHHPRINLDLRNSAGRAVLHYLVQLADLDTLAHFLDLPEFDVNVQDRQGNTPLHVATTLRKLDVMKRILDVYGIRLDMTDNLGRTPLTVATYWGYHDAALVLIEHSKAFPTPERDQLSSLICAAKQEDLELTDILLEKYRYRNLDYHIDLSGKGVLHYAAVNSWPHVLEQILSHGDKNTNVNKIDHSGGSALHCAAALGNTACCEVLLKHGASARLQDRNGRTAAHAAADAGFKDTLTVLVRADDVDVNQRDHQGRNLVHWTATIDCVDLIKEVVQRQPTIEIARRDNMGRMPMDIAFICKCPNVGRFLEREIGLRRATSLWVNIYNWDGLYSNAVVEFDGTADEKDDYWQMQEGSLLFRESIRKQRTEEEWEKLHRRYPEEIWALVIVPKDENP